MRRIQVLFILVERYREVFKLHTLLYLNFYFFEYFIYEYYICIISLFHSPSSKSPSLASDVHNLLFLVIATFISSY